MWRPPGSPFRPLYDDRILFSGQPVALVRRRGMGDRAVRGVAGARRIRDRKRTRPTSCARTRRGVRSREKPPIEAARRCRRRRCAAAAGPPRRRVSRARSSITTRWSRTPRPSICEGDGKLTIYDKTQGRAECRRAISCSVFGLAKDERARASRPIVGGAFGSGLRPHYQVVLAVMAARALKRSVRVVLTRQQMFTPRLSAGHRSSRSRSAPPPAARSTRSLHEAVAITSRYEDFQRNDHQLVRRCSISAPHAKFAHKLARLDLATPGDMRAPGAATAACMRSNARWTSLPSQLEPRSDRAAAALLLRARPERRQALHQQGAARVLPRGRAKLRLGQARARAALDARRATSSSAAAWRPASGKRCR